jgi:hypothetical protein
MVGQEVKQFVGILFMMFATFDTSEQEKRIPIS